MWIASNKRTVTLLVSVALLGLVAYASSSQFSRPSLRNSNMEKLVTLDEDKSSTYYFVTSEWKNKDDADKWWKLNDDVNGDPDRAKKATEDDAKAGFHPLFFMPTAKDGTFYMVWEAKAGKSKKDLEDYMSQKDTTCGEMASYFNNKVQQITAPLPYSYFNSKSRRLGSSFQEDKKDDKATYVLVHHSFKHDDDIKPWWKALTAVMKSPDKLKKMQEDFKKAGYTNPAFMPLATEGPIFCLWKVDPDNTEAGLKEFLSKTPPMNQLHNEYLPIPNKLMGGFPGPYL